MVKSDWEGVPGFDPIPPTLWTKVSSRSRTNVFLFEVFSGSKYFFLLLLVPSLGDKDR